MQIAFAISGLMVIGGAGLTVISMLRTQRVALRLVGLELVLTLTVCAIGVEAALTVSDEFLDILVAVAALAFAATIVVSGWLRTRGD